MNKIKCFTDLIAWQEGHRLVLLVYKTTKTFPKKEIYSITNQMRRAVISITNNIAEGFGRKTYKEKVHFYYLAQGSLTELKNLIIIAIDIKYLSKNQYNSLFVQANTAHKLLQGLIKKSKIILNHKFKA